MFRKIKRYKKIRFSLRKIYVFLIVSAVISSIICSISFFNQRIIPSVIEIVRIEAQSDINRLLNDSIKKISDELGLNSSDFYTKSVDNSGKINSFSVNTILINEVCARIAADVSAKLSDSSVQTISVPMGMLLGIDIFANKGLKYNVKILPKGNTLVDYETEFKSAGINQVNFQIWLTADSKIQIVNPLQGEEISVSRKIALVNAVINGEVPPAYIPSFSLKNVE